MAQDHDISTTLTIYASIRMICSFKNHLTLMLIGVGLLTACAEERPPRSVTEMLENPNLLEATMVRCSEDRDATRYDAECINARQAVRQIEAKEEAARREDDEARSESKRQALRRTQAAAAQARRRTAEAERQRKEAEYLAQFGVAPPTEVQTTGDEAEMGNSPIAVIPESDENETLHSGPGDVLPATDGGNAPASSEQAEEESPSTDLGSIRDELQRRNDEEND
jgi:hypothetical protein